MVLHLLRGFLRPWLRLLPSSCSLGAISWLSSNLESRFLILNEIFFLGNYFLLIRRQGCQSLGSGLTPFLYSQGWGLLRYRVAAPATETAWIGPISCRRPENF